MKKALVIWFFVAALVAMGCSPPPDSFGSVDTLQDSWIEIWDWYDLDDVRNNLSGSYILMTDLDSTSAGYDELASPTANDGRGWWPIGGFGARFRGRLDGRGHEIRDLFIDRPDEDWVGLFSYVGMGGIIEHLGLTNASVTANNFVGTLAGRNPEGTLRDCYVSGYVSGLNMVGLLVGSISTYGTVVSCYSIGSVNATKNYVGGLTGYNRGTVADSYSSASVSAEGVVGGLVGGNHYAIIRNSYSTGSVLGYGGGLVGWNNAAAIINCYSTGEASHGGLVGSNTDGGTVDNSFWDTETSGTAVSAGGTGKTTAQMMDIATFLDAGWDIAITTLGDPTEGYPFLSWQLEGSPTWLIHEGTPTECVEATTGTGEVCFTTSHGFIEDLEAMPAVPPSAPAGIMFPHGMFSFEVTGLALGQTVTITVELPEPVPTGTRWWKEHMGAWYSIPVTVVEPNIISFTLTDGVFPGDSDNTEDGVITDPGGPGYPLSLGYTVGWEGQPINKVAVMAPWIGLLAAIAGASLLVLRRRQTQS